MPSADIPANAGAVLTVDLDAVERPRVEHPAAAPRCGCPSQRRAASTGRHRHAERIGQLQDHAHLLLAPDAHHRLGMKKNLAAVEAGFPQRGRVGRHHL